VADKERDAKLRVMSAEERLIALEKERAEAAALANEETEAGLEAKLKMLELDERIAREKEALDKQESVIADSGPNVKGDFLARIGGGGRTFVGPEKAAQSTRERMLSEQKRTNQILENLDLAEPDPTMRA